MPAFRNTDNGRVIEVAESEAFIYEKASNFERVTEEKPPAPVPLAPTPTKTRAKKKA
jgi:hypothetical protein